MSPESSQILLQQVAFGSIAVLLVGVTLGVGYLTFSEWRDRRRRQQSEGRRGPFASKRGQTKRR